MRSIFILAAGMAPLFLANASVAVGYDNDCRVSCAAERDTRVGACPSPYDSNGGREQCLKDAQDAYNACIDRCPPPDQPQSKPTPMSQQAALSGQ